MKSLIESVAAFIFVLGIMSVLLLPSVVFGLMLAQSGYETAFLTNFLLIDLFLIITTFSLSTYITDKIHE